MLILRSRHLFSCALVAALGLTAATARADEGSRWVAAVPFGAGQFQRGDTGLGIFFAVGEATLGAVSIGTVVSVNALASVDTRAFAADRLSSLNQSIQTVAVVNRIAFAGWAALTAAGIIEAQVSFGPRKERPRASIVPVAAPLPGGGVIALQGTF